MVKYTCFVLSLFFFKAIEQRGQVKSYALGRTRRNCTVFECGGTNVTRLLIKSSRPSSQDGYCRTKNWLKRSKIRISVPLENKDAKKKEISMANTLKRLIKQQEEMAANINDILKGTTDSHKDKKVQ